VEKKKRRRGESRCGRQKGGKRNLIFETCGGKRKDAPSFPDFQKKGQEDRFSLSQKREKKGGKRKEGGSERHRGAAGGKKRRSRKTIAPLRSSEKGGENGVPRCWLKIEKKERKTAPPPIQKKKKEGECGSTTSSFLKRKKKRENSRGAFENGSCVDGKRRVEGGKRESEGGIKKETR